MPKGILTSDQVLALLADMPPHLARLTAGLEPRQLRAIPSAGEWSIHAVLSHLRTCADVWGGCIAQVVRSL